MRQFFSDARGNAKLMINIFWQNPRLFINYSSLSSTEDYKFMTCFKTKGVIALWRLCLFKRRAKLFVGQILRHFSKISSLSPDKLSPDKALSIYGAPEIHNKKGTSEIDDNDISTKLKGKL